MSAASSPAARAAPARFVIAAGLAACAAGLLAHRLWTELPAGRVIELLAIAGLVALLAWGLVVARRLAWPTALACAWGLALVTMAGPVAVLAVLLVVAGALAAGSVLESGASPALAFVLGAALLAGALGWLLPWPIHLPFVYAPVLVALVAWRRRRLRAYLLRGRVAWTRAVGRAPRSATLAISLLGIASTGCWLPTLQYDDLAYHLGLPWQLMLHARYALDPTHQVAALAPWAGDVLQAVPQVLARGETRGALNAAWLLAIAALLWRIARDLGLAPRARWIVLALLGSLPLLPALLAAMHTELPATAATLALATFVSTPTQASTRGVYAVAALSGLLLALKLTHPVAAAVLALAAAWRLRGAIRRAPLHLAGAAALTAGIGGSSYAYAHAVAGNPVLPYFNATFRSPYFPPHDFHDARWQGDGLLSPWFLTFDTSRYLEGWDGGFGFALIALGGAALVALADRRTRLLAASAIAATLLPLVLVGYGRYAFPGLVLLLPVAVHAVFASFSTRAAAAALVGLALLDLAFLPNAQWHVHTGAAKRALLAGGRDEPLLRRYAPERIVHARIRAHGAAGRVLDLGAATHAELAGNGRTTTWYAPAMQVAARAADADASGAAWAALLDSERISDVLARPANRTPAQAAGLARRGAYRVLTVGDVEWWRIPPQDRR